MKVALAGRADVNHHRSRLLQAFDIVTGYRTYPGHRYWPGQPPSWAFSMSTREARRVAVGLLERLAGLDHLKRYGIEKRLTHARGALAAAKR